MPTDPNLAIEKYRRHAPTYDRDVAWGEAIRRTTVSRLRLKPGEVVLDVACGTGLSFPLIEEAIGRDGRVIGIEMSPDMLAKARERIAAHKWENIALVHSSVEEANIPESADAVLFSVAHDVMRSPRALQNVFQQVKPGGRVVASGPKWAPWWAVPVNIGVWYVAGKYVTTFEGFDQPWSNLIRFVPDFQTESAFLGAVYIGWGTVPGSEISPNAPPRKSQLAG